MSTHDMPVLRQPIVGASTRRLPGRMLEISPSEQPANTLRNREDVLTSLKENFAGELAKLRDEARREGLATGRRDGEIAARQALEEARKEWEKEEERLRLVLADEQRRTVEVISALQAASEQLSQRMAPVLGRLALQIVVKFLGRHHEARPLLGDLVAHVLETYRLEGPVHVHLAPEDHARVCRSGLHDELLSCMVVDASLMPGSCIIDHGAGRLEADLDIQWSALKQALLSDLEVRHVADA